VFKDTYPVQWTGGQAVVMLPEHINAANAGQIREELLALINRGATALIADMTATASCDYAGAEALVRAYRRAVANGTQLRLVVPAEIVRRVLSGNGLDRLASIYPSRGGGHRRRPAGSAGLRGRPVAGQPGPARRHRP
jgi:anti-anti-sigma factor